MLKGKYGYIDYIKMVGTPSATVTPEPVYNITINADKTSVEKGGTVKLTAKVTVDGAEVTDLSATGLYVYWSHNAESGKQDAEYSDSTSSLTMDVTLPSEGEYYFTAKLQDSAWTTVKEAYITLTGTAVTSGGESNDKVSDDNGNNNAGSNDNSGNNGDENNNNSNTDNGNDNSNDNTTNQTTTETEVVKNVELVNADFTSALDGTWTGEVTGGWGEGNAMDVVSYSEDSYLKLPSYVAKSSGSNYSWGYIDSISMSTTIKYTGDTPNAIVYAVIMMAGVAVVGYTISKKRKVEF